MTNRNTIKIEPLIFYFDRFLRLKMSIITKINHLYTYKIIQKVLVKLYGSIKKNIHVKIESKSAEIWYRDYTNDKSKSNQNWIVISLVRTLPTIQYVYKYRNRLFNIIYLNSKTKLSKICVSKKKHTCQNRIEIWCNIIYKIFVFCLGTHLRTN